MRTFYRLDEYKLNEQRAFGKATDKERQKRYMPIYNWKKNNPNSKKRFEIKTIDGIVYIRRTK